MSADASVFPDHGIVPALKKITDRDITVDHGACPDEATMAELRRQCVGLVKQANDCSRLVDYVM
jgi:hypothetical protein